MKRDIEILNKIYKIVDMGIIGIEEVIEKIEDKCLEKVMLDQKKDYMVIRTDVKNLLMEYEEDPKKINPVVRLSNDIYTNMKLLGNENDSELAKMMLKGTNTGIIELTNIKNEDKFKNKKVKDLVLHTLKVLEYNEKELKKYL